jgi:hypothetical protein
MTLSPVGGGQVALQVLPGRNHQPLNVRIEQAA